MKWKTREKISEIKSRSFEKNETDKLPARLISKKEGEKT